MESQLETAAISIPIHSIHGDLTIPKHATSLVIFAHARANSRHSPRNKFVARILNNSGIATLLVDLLTPEEDLIDERTSYYRFDIPLLADRLIGATDWLKEQQHLSDFRLGYFGTDTGAALVVAGKRPDPVSAIVYAGGRPDLAKEYLHKMIAPTLLIVGEYDFEAIRLNRGAAQAIGAPTSLKIVPALCIYSKSKALWSGLFWQEPGLRISSS
jgi:hypothetical protein